MNWERGSGRKRGREVVEDFLWAVDYMLVTFSPSFLPQWSYAVTVWEILTLVEMPYSEVDNNRSILSQLMMGERLSQPEGCPDNL